MISDLIGICINYYGKVDEVINLRVREGLREVNFFVWLLFIMIGELYIEKGREKLNL